MNESQLWNVVPVCYMCDWNNKTTVLLVVDVVFVPPLDATSRPGNDVFTASQELGLLLLATPPSPPSDRWWYLYIPHHLFFWPNTKVDIQCILLNLWILCRSTYRFVFYLSAILLDFFLSFSNSFNSGLKSQKDEEGRLLIRLALNGLSLIIITLWVLLLVPYTRNTRLHSVCIYIIYNASDRH